MATTFSVTQLIAAEVETLLYSKLHDLLAVIAEDYGLNHGEMVEKYLIKTREGSPPPQFIYKSTDAETPEAPKKARKAKVKVTKEKSSDSEDDREGKCTAKTAKGTLCKNKAFGGGCTCRVHTPKEKEDGEVSDSEEKPKKVPKKRGRKPKAKEPEHDHKMDEVGSDCELCETHGNPAEGEQEFEIPKAASKRESIRKMLEEEFEDVSEQELAELEEELKELKTDEVSEEEFE
jgi:hypothetical protein